MTVHFPPPHTVWSVASIVKPTPLIPQICPIQIRHSVHKYVTAGALGQSLITSHLDNHNTYSLLCLPITSVHGTKGQLLKPYLTMAAFFWKPLLVLHCLSQTLRQSTNHTKGQLQSSDPCEAVEPYTFSFTSCSCVPIIPTVHSFPQSSNCSSCLPIWKCFISVLEPTGTSHWAKFYSAFETQTGVSLENIPSHSLRINCSLFTSSPLCLSFKCSMSHVVCLFKTHVCFSSQIMAHSGRTRGLVVNDAALRHTLRTRHFVKVCEGRKTSTEGQGSHNMFASVTSASEALIRCPNGPGAHWAP